MSGCFRLNIGIHLIGQQLLNSQPSNGAPQGLSIMTASGETVRDLAERIRTLETSFRLVEPTAIPLGAGGLGDLFPGGRLSTGSLVELLPSAPGAGAWTLALLLARHA